MKLLIALTLVALTSALNADLEWNQFKVKYGRQYSSPREESMRKSIFQSNLAYIEAHNAAFKLGEVTFSLGLNEFADMHNDEFVKRMNGYHVSSLPRDQLVYTSNGDVRDLPDTVDWRTKGYVTPVKNQGSCGSCWAFSSTGSLEGQTFKKYGRLTSLSEQNLMDCSTKQGNHGCNGGTMDQSFTYIKENKGIDTETSYPYRARDETCKFNPANVGANDTGFVDIESKSESALQTAVANVGPISVAIDASHLSFQFYRGGVYHSYLCSQTRLDHGVLAVGYGKYEDKDYWLVKNSWGTTWGLKGYIMMSRNRDNNCGIATNASYPIV